LLADGGAYCSCGSDGLYFGRGKQQLALVDEWDGEERRKRAGQRWMGGAGRTKEEVVDAGLEWNPKPNVGKEEGGRK